MNHQIQKQILDVTLHAPESEAFGWQHRLSEWANSSLTAALARALDACAPAEEHWQIEALVIELNAVNLENFETEMPHKIAQALEQSIKEEQRQHAQQNLTQSVGLKTIYQNTVEAFVYFLQTGLLPWAYRLPRGQTWEQTILQTFSQASLPLPIKTALFSLLKNTQARERLTAQFSQSFLEEIVTVFDAQSKTQIKRFFDTWFETHDSSNEWSGREIWSEIWKYMAIEDKIVLDKIIQQYHQKQDDSKRQRIEKVIALLEQREKGNWAILLAELQTINPKVETLKAPVDYLTQQTITANQPNNIALPDIKEIYVQCAGLVLLHPFLPRFFEGILCAADDELVWFEKAALSLYFLATGQSEAAEYELPMVKILCGIPINQTLPKAVTWQPQDTEEAEALLGAVIKYWPILKNSSIDLLRAEFLQRAGKLSRRADGWLLQVEKRDFDFYLLSALPWSFSTIKLPWMQEFLWVEWV